MNINKQALIYCRVSSKQQLDGGGLGSQEQRCQEYAKFKGYEVVEIFQDSFSGGGDFMKRPAMRQLLAYVDERPQNQYVVIFDDLKRFARDVKFHWELRSEFESRHLIPECLNFKFEETPEGFFIETIIAAQGELERQQQKRQVLQKMKARMQRGLCCFPTAPYGYTYVASSLHGGKILKIDKEASRIVKMAFSQFADGKLFHLRDVTKFLTTNSVRKKKVAFKDETVKSMLSNVIYIGFLEYPTWNIELTKGVHDPIIPLELFEKVQTRLKGKIPQRIRVDMREDFPLRGYVNCIHCKRQLTASWSTGRVGSKHPYYRCHTKGCVMAGKSIQKKELHDFFEEYIKPLAFKPQIKTIAKLKILEEALRRNKIKYVELEKKKQEIILIDGQIETLVERLSVPLNKSIADIYESQISNLNKKRILLNEISIKDDTNPELLEPIVDIAFKKTENPYATWKKDKYELQKQVLNMLFYTNLEYGKKEKFGNTNEAYLLRLFKRIEVENNQNLQHVEITDFSWKQSLKNKYQWHTFLEDHWDEILTDIKRIASLDEISKQNVSYNKVA
jgi:DNA invertase Pin-like site-specific DNA recombinase